MLNPINEEFKELLGSLPLVYQMTARTILQFSKAHPPGIVISSCHLRPIHETEEE
jgi:hypothetical protein